MGVHDIFGDSAWLSLGHGRDDAVLGHGRDDDVLGHGRDDDLGLCRDNVLGHGRDDDVLGHGRDDVGLVLHLGDHVGLVLHLGDDVGLNDVGLSSCWHNDISGNSSLRLGGNHDGLGR